MADEYDLVPVGHDPFAYDPQQPAQTLPRTRVPLPSESDITPSERPGWQPPPPVSDPESLVWRDPVPGFGIRRGTALDHLIPEDVSGRSYLERLRDNAGAVADKFRDTFERTADYAASRDPRSLLPHWLRSQLRPGWFNATPVENLPPRYRDDALQWLNPTPAEPTPATPLPRYRQKLGFSDDLFGPMQGSIVPSDALEDAKLYERMNSIRMDTDRLMTPDNLRRGWAATDPSITHFYPDYSHTDLARDAGINDIGKRWVANDALADLLSETARVDALSRGR